MKSGKRTLGLLTAVLCLANPFFNLQAASSAGGNDAATQNALEAAMTPGAGQEKLNVLVGTFDVRIRTWITPGSEPVESTGSMVSAWVLGGRYVQSMLAGTVAGEPFNGIGYVGYDNVSKMYQVAWMDTGSTGMTLYSGGFDESGMSATMKASVLNELTSKPALVELRLTIDPEGNHVTELWGPGMGTEMFRMMELVYTRATQ
jgi:hypothetical protein